MIPLLLALAALLAGCAQVDRPVKKAEEKKVLAEEPRQHKASDPHYYSYGAGNSAPPPAKPATDNWAADLYKEYPELQRHGGMVPWLGSLEKRVHELEREKRVSGVEKETGDIRVELELMNKVDHVQNEVMNELVQRIQRLEAGRAPGTPIHFYAPQSTPMYGRTP